MKTVEPLGRMRSDLDRSSQSDMATIARRDQQHGPPGKQSRCWQLRSAFMFSRRSRPLRPSFIQSSRPPASGHRCIPTISLAFYTSFFFPHFSSLRFIIIIIITIHTFRLYWVFLAGLQRRWRKGKINNIVTFIMVYKHIYIYFGRPPP